MLISTEEKEECLDYIRHKADDLGVPPDVLLTVLLKAFQPHASSRLFTFFQEEPISILWGIGRRHPWAAIGEPSRLAEAEGHFKLGQSGSPVWNILKPYPGSGKSCIVEGSLAVEPVWASWIGHHSQAAADPQSTPKNEPLANFLKQRRVAKQHSESKVTSEDVDQALRFVRQEEEEPAVRKK